MSHRSNFFYNNFQLGGFVKKKGELKTVHPSGDKVLEITLGCRGNGRDSEGRRVTDFFTLEVWRDKAELMNQLIEVDNDILVDGKIKHERWTTPTGEQRFTYKFLVSNFRLVNKNNNENVETEA